MMTMGYSNDNDDGMVLAITMATMLMIMTTMTMTMTMGLADCAAHSALFLPRHLDVCSKFVHRIIIVVIIVTRYTSLYCVFDYCIIIMII